MSDVVTNFRLSENKKDLELIVDLDPNAPSVMRGDIKRLHKIFRHLLENAVKFTKSGGIYLRMYTEETEYGVNLCIEMNDTGIGMDMKDLNSVSEGIYQANKKRNRSSGGIGLGLYIVRTVVGLHGGEIKVSSKLGEYTEFEFHFPRYDKSAE